MTGMPTILSIKIPKTYIHKSSSGYGKREFIVISSSIPTFIQVRLKQEILLGLEALPKIPPPSIEEKAKIITNMILDAIDKVVDQVIHQYNLTFSPLHVLLDGDSNANYLDDFYITPGNDYRIGEFDLVLYDE